MKRKLHLPVLLTLLGLAALSAYGNKIAPLSAASGPASKPGADVPASPLEKPGWELTFHDEFDGPALDANRWQAEYFAGRFKTPQKTDYELRDGCLAIRLRRGEAPLFCSSVQTFNCYGLHKIYAQRESDVKRWEGFTQLYGWYEVRAKHPAALQSHNMALWALEAKPGGGELDIIEDAAYGGPNIHGIVPGEPISVYDPNGQVHAMTYKQLKAFDPINRLTNVQDRAEHFHLYAMEIYPEGARFYYDNRLLVDAPINWKARGETPLMFIMGLYPPIKPGFDRAEYIIDYFRAYKPATRPAQNK